MGLRSGLGEDSDHNREVGAGGCLDRESGASVRFTTTFQELLGTDVQGWIGGFVSVVSGMEIPSHEHSSF